jgi:Fe2+ transport system protein FeoA
MPIPLLGAAVGVTLVLSRVTDAHLAKELRQMGIFEGDEVVRLDEEVLMQPLKVRGPQGDAVLSCGMASKIVVHFDDGRKIPLVEMQPREHGHMEGITGGPEFMHALDVLGLNRNDEIQLLRKLPPMEYITRIGGKKRSHLTEGMAVKIWGKIADTEMQFVSAQTGKDFLITDILGGKNVQLALQGYGIDVGSVLVLEGVAQAQCVIMNQIHPFVALSTSGGLRLFFHEHQARHIYLKPKDPPQ